MIGEWNNGTGRRESSVARVFLKRHRQITVNARTSSPTSDRETSIMIAEQPWC